MRIFLFLAALPAFLSLSISCPANDLARPSKVAEVLAGERTEAKAAWWGFDPGDSTEYLQSAIDSGAEKLIVENTGRDWVVGPVKVASNIEIVFEDGVVVRAKEGEFKGRTEKLFDIYEQENVILRGEGDVVFEMRKSDYQNPELYTPGSHRHTINIFTSRNVLIQNLTLRSSGGDGVYVGHHPRKRPSENITIYRVVCEDHLRQGISVTGVTNMLVKDSSFNYTSGSAPECGIDIEPNYPQNSIVNFRAVNCDFNWNDNAGIWINLSKLDETSEPASITFENCRIKDNQRGIIIWHSGSGTPSEAGRIEFIDCEISGTKNRSIAVHAHLVENLDIVFDGINVDNKGSGYGAMYVTSPVRENIHGLHVRGLSVTEDRERPPIEFSSSFGNGLVGAVVEDVSARRNGDSIEFDAEAFLEESRPDPKAMAFRTLPLDIQALKPVSVEGKPAGADIRFRGQFEYLLFAEDGENIKVSFIHRTTPIYRRERYMAPLEVSVFNPWGRKVDEFKIPFEETVEYVLSASGAGVYRFEVDTRVHTVSVVSDSPGQGIPARGVERKGAEYYIQGSSGRLYFHVPAGVKTIQIEAAERRRHALSASLVCPEGNDVDSGPGTGGYKILAHTRPDASEDEIWSVRFSARYLYLRIGDPLVPVFSTAPENLLAGGSR